MPKFLIEREIPGAGSLSPQELQGISQTSCGVLQKMGPQIQWLQSYVTGDKIYCVYIAPNEEMIRETREPGGLSCKSCFGNQIHHRSHNREEKKQSAADSPTIVSGMAGR